MSDITDKLRTACMQQIINAAPGELEAILESIENVRGESAYKAVIDDLDFNEDVVLTSLKERQDVNPSPAKMVDISMYADLERHTVSHTLKSLKSKDLVHKVKGGWTINPAIRKIVC